MAFELTKFVDSLASSLSKERVDQKTIQRRAYDYYNCNSEAHLDDTLAKQFVDWANEKKTILFKELAVTKSIVDEISLVYREEPERTFNRNGEEIPDGDLKDQLNEIYDNFGNMFFQMHERMVNTLSTVAVMMEFNQETGQLELDILTPDRYDVVVDNLRTTEATAFFYQVDTVDDMTNKQYIMRFFYIDDEEISEVRTGLMLEPSDVYKGTANIKTFSYGDNKNQTNPLGFIPIVTTTSQTQVIDYFVDSNARRLSKGEDVLIAKDVSSNETAFNQGFSTLVYTTEEAGAIQGDVSDKVQVSPKVMAKIKNGSQDRLPEKLEYIAPPTKLADLSDDYKESYLNLAATFGLNEGEGNVKANASGVSLVVSDDKKNKLINASRPIYIRFEKKLFAMIKKFSAIYSALPKIPDDLELSVNFKEVETTLGVNDRIDSEQHDIDNDMRPKWRILMDRDPELTEEDAKKLIEEAEKESAERQRAINEMTNPNNEEGSEDDDDVSDSEDDEPPTEGNQDV